MARHLGGKRCTEGRLQVGFENDRITVCESTVEFPRKGKITGAENVDGPSEIEDLIPFRRFPYARCAVKGEMKEKKERSECDQRLHNRHSLGFRAERLDHVLVALHVRPLNQVDAVRNGGENGVEAFADRFWLSGKIDDEAFPADSRGLTGQNRRRDVFEAHLAHQLSKAWHHLFTDVFGRFGGDVAPRGARPTRSHHEAALFLIAQFDHRLLDRILIVGNAAVDDLVGTFEIIPHRLLDRNP